MLLLMPLTLPAFEKAVGERLKSWRIALAAITLVGAFVQIVGLSVYVTTNQWYQARHGIHKAIDSVFMPSASPVWVQLRDLSAGRNLIPWAFRAISHPGPEVILLAALLFVIGAGARFLRAHPTSAGEPALPGVSLLVMSSLVLLGSLATSPVVAPVEVRIADHVDAGLAAQRAGRDIEAEELFALVLSLEPTNKLALHNLARLYEKSGQRAAAVPLYKRALASDPGFTPSARNLSRYGARELPAFATTQICTNADQCYDAGKRFWDLGNRAAALALWERAVQAYPGEVWLIRHVARAQYELGDFEASAREYRKAAGLSPRDDGVRTDLAWALLATSHFQEAREICDEVLSHDNANVAAQAVLAQLPK
jgi:Tfp pilus assembly protein PilF